MEWSWVHRKGINSVQGVSLHTSQNLWQCEHLMLAWYICQNSETNTDPLSSRKLQTLLRFHKFLHYSPFCTSESNLGYHIACGQHHILNHTLTLTVNRIMIWLITVTNKNSEKNRWHSTMNNNHLLYLVFNKRLMYCTKPISW